MADTGQAKDAPEFSLWQYRTELDNVVTAMLREIDRTAEETMDKLMDCLPMEAGATKTLKAVNPMKWVRLMNACRNQAEEIPLSAEQADNIERAESRGLSAFSVRQEDIDNILRLGSNSDAYYNGSSGSRMRIAVEYMKKKSDGEIAPFLHKEFHGGFGFHTLRGDVTAWYADDGIHIAYGNAARYHPSAQILSWLDAAARIRTLLEQGDFATNPFHL